MTPGTTKQFAVLLSSVPFHYRRRLPSQAPLMLAGAFDENFLKEDTHGKLAA
jgi:hypothetical protein